jgi:hypothetical protein
MSEVIHALLGHENVSFGPEEVAKLVAGFESALTKLDLKDRCEALSRNNFGNR